MKFKHCIYFLSVLFLVSSCAVKKTIVFQSPLKTTVFQSALDSIYKAHPASTGLMVHIEAPDQKISWSGAVGFSDKINKTPVQADQPALIASNTKTYTSVSILRLIEQNKIQFNQPIKDLISDKSKNLLQSVGYDLQSISIAHLLSHTSGITDYVNEDYMIAIDKDQKHRWTRNEQIELATKVGGPLGKAGDVFSYADVNYLLLTEIIERITGENYYTAISELIGYKKHQLNETWFVSLDEKPKGIKPLVHQYYGDLGWDSYNLDPSFDLYGAGGIAATTKDLALFFQFLFEGKIIENKEVLNLIFSKIETKDSSDPHYFMGVMDSKINGFKAYGHGGFWGTAVQYFPELNASISVYVLERDNRILRKDMLEKMVELIGRNENRED